MQTLVRQRVHGVACKQWSLCSASRYSAIIRQLQCLMVPLVSQATNGDPPVYNSSQDAAATLHRAMQVPAGHRTATHHRSQQQRDQWHRLTPMGNHADLPGSSHAQPRMAACGGHLRSSTCKQLHPAAASNACFLHGLGHARHLTHSTAAEAAEGCDASNLGSRPGSVDRQAWTHASHGATQQQQQVNTESRIASSEVPPTGSAFPHLAAARSVRAAARAHKPSLPQREEGGGMGMVKRLVVEGGAGGGGGVSFEPAAMGRTRVSTGGPGGPGGDVVVRAVRGAAGLGGLPSRVRAGRGGRGGASGRAGARGEDIVLLVPLGTSVIRVEPAIPQTLYTENVPRSSGNDSGGHAGPWVAGTSHSGTLLAARPLAAGSSDEGAADEGSEEDVSEEEDYEGRVYRSAGESGDEDDAVSHAGGTTDGEGSSRSSMTDDDAYNDDDASSSDSEGGDGYDHEQSDGAHADEEEEEEEEVLQRGRLYGASRISVSGGEVVLAELTEAGQQVVVACGGAGGRGNASMAPRHRKHMPRPRGADRQEPADGMQEDAGQGQPGEGAVLLLRTRLLADVALVGMPNAGKSSLLSALTAARAKVGAYAFTTVRPQLGTMQLDIHSSQDSADRTSSSSSSSSSGCSSQTRSLVLADIPGLVAGAGASGRGRGAAFLSAVDKCRAVLYVVDMSGGLEGQQGIEQQQQQQLQGLDHVDGGGGLVQERQQGQQQKVYESSLSVLGGVGLAAEAQLALLQEELRAYSPRLAAAPALVACTKLDRLTPPQARAVLDRLKRATPLPLLPVSALQGAGLQRLQQALLQVAGPAAGRPAGS